jgi:hypothetical protein
MGIGESFGAGVSKPCERGLGVLSGRCVRRCGWALVVLSGQVRSGLVTVIGGSFGAVVFRPCERPLGVFREVCQALWMGVGGSFEAWISRPCGEALVGLSGHGCPGLVDGRWWVLRGRCTQGVRMGVGGSFGAASVFLWGGVRGLTRRVVPSELGACRLE